MKSQDTRRRGRKRIEYRPCDQCADNIEVFNLRPSGDRMLCAWCAPELWAAAREEGLAPKWQTATHRWRLGLGSSGIAVVSLKGARWGSG